MGNRMYRSHTARYAAAAARIRREMMEHSENAQESSSKIKSKLLCRSKTPGVYQSFADFEKTEKPSLLTSTLIIDQDSLKLSESLSFNFSNKSAATVTAFFFAKELIDGKSKSMYFSLDPRSPQPLSQKFSEDFSGLVKFEVGSKLKEFKSADWEFEDRSTFPLILLAKSGDEHLIVYFKVVNGKVEKVRENYSNSTGSFEVVEIFWNCSDECVGCGEQDCCEYFVPCGHSCACKKCIDIIVKQGRRCPMCRSYIFGWCNKFG
jgi:hypothetical protein